MADASTLGGRYRVERPPIGQGGMGVVYRAFDTVTKRHVALKTVRGPVDPSGIELFQREWTVLARLCHPNIIDILDIGEFIEEGVQKPYFVMPLLPGMTLDKLIKTAGQRLTTDRVVEIISQACRGLQAAHDQNLVHRDIKPSNLFVMNDDSVKIIDFGVVHLADAATRTGIKGTLQYMAPEQLENKPATAKSDIFSLGVVCYEALTGRKPFEGETFEAITDAIRCQVPPPLTDLNPAVSDQFSRAIHRALAKVPYHRFSSAKEFSEVLQRAGRGELVEILSPVRIQPRLTRVKRALTEGDHQFALEVLGELESEGNVDPEISVLRMRAQQGIRDKTIRQLLESARTRFEEEEYPLALQKVQDVLALDPRNADAAALKTQIERKRSAAQIDRWLELAHQHLQNKSFQKAREAAEEVLKIDRNHASARSLVSEISRAQEEATKFRQERHQLYESALKAYQNGEISSALSRLERVIQLGKVSPGHPTTDAQYLALYEQVRSERDELRDRYTEIRRLVEGQDFERALNICRQVLGHRPGEALFASLRIEIEERQRQDRSGRIAEIQSRAEAEPDLERKYAILNDAVQQFPGEQAFQRALSSVKERRDLVNSIVAKARRYESQGQFADAVNQWELLRNIYGKHPGLQFEVERLSRKQQEQIREGQRTTWITRIDQAVQSSRYSEARGIVKSALREIPDDPELLRLQERVDKDFERAQRASTLLQEGGNLAAQGRYPESIERLRSADDVEANNPAIQAQLSATLVQYAKVLAQRDPDAAARLLQEADQFSPGDPNVSSVFSFVQDVRRCNSIQLAIAEAHELQKKNALPEASRRVANALSDYPGEPQLVRLQHTLDTAIVKEEPRSRAAVAAFGGATNYLNDTPPLSVPGAANAGTTAGQHPRDEVETPPGWVSMLRSRRTLAVAGVMAVLMLVLGILLLRTNQSAGSKSVQAPTAAQAAVTQPAPRPEPPGAGAEASPVPPSNPDPAIPGPIPVKTVTVHFDSDPSGADITADGKDDLSCSTPCDLTLPYGRHTIAAKAEGHSPRRQVLQVPKQRSAWFIFGDELKSVYFNSVPPGMELTVDGKAHGETPLTIRLAPGNHDVRAVKGDLSISQSIAISDDDVPQTFLIQQKSDTP